MGSGPGSSPEAGKYAGVEAGADAAQEDGPDALDLRDCTHYGAPVVRVGSVPLFVEGADNYGSVRWQGALPDDDIPQALGEEAEEVGREVIVRVRSEAVVARGWMFSETTDCLTDFMDGQGALP